MSADTSVSTVQARVESGAQLNRLVVCSLEPWDDIWRRNQFFVDILLRRNDDLRVLFVEPPSDPLFDLSSRRIPTYPRICARGYGGRLRALRPLKPLPRRAGVLADATLCTQVVLAARVLGFASPVLWINDVTYAPLIRSTGWRSLYDVTDDWLAAPFSPRELTRLRRLDRLALDGADAVTVCSNALAVSRGRTRTVTTISNAVDAEHFRLPRPRPDDLPPKPVAAYVGTLHESRLDVDLVIELAKSLPELNVVLVGPDALAVGSRMRLGALPNVTLLGARPYGDVPAYLQHADVVVVPHRIDEFTDSLDPIKAYESLVLDVPTVATPVAGFRELGGQVRVAPPDAFAAAVGRALAEGGTPARGDPPTWEARAAQFERVLVEIAQRFS